MTSKEKDSYILEHWQEQSDRELAKNCGLTPKAVESRRLKMELRRTALPKNVPEPLPDEEQVAQDSEITRLRDELGRLRKLYKLATRERSSDEALIVAIREVVPTFEPVTPPKPVQINGKVETETAVLLLGDLHIGEVVDEEETGGIAVYDLDIAHRRVMHTVQTAVKMTKEHLKGGYHIPNIEVFGLGDFVSGIIHKELEVTNEVGIVEQVMVAAEMTAEALLLLCQHFEHVTFTGVVGNHGRVEMHKYFKMKAKNNYDRMVYLIVEKMLKDQPNLTMNVPMSFWTIRKVENTRFLLLHGDQIKGWMGFPVYGANRAYMKMRSLLEGYGNGFDTMVMAHFHTPNIWNIQRDEVICNGSTKGGDEYALGAISAACDPVQILFGVHPRRGRTWTYYINSSEVK